MGSIVKHAQLFWNNVIPIAACWHGLYRAQIGYSTSAFPREQCVPIIKTVTNFALWETLNLFMCAGSAPIYFFLLKDKKEKKYIFFS